MSEYLGRDVLINGSSVKIRHKGEGAPLALMMGFGGAPDWPEFAEILSATRHVYLISLPGQDGSERGHDHLHTPLDWIVAAMETIEQGIGLERPFDLVACSAAGILATEIAAFAQHRLRSLILIGPLGLYDPANPPRNPFDEAPFMRPKILMADQERYKQTFDPPAHLEEMERRLFEIDRYRCDEAMARLIWPFGDIKGRRRLHRINSTPTLLIWGEEDKVVPSAYAQKYAELIPVSLKTEIIPGAGHLCMYDQPERVAQTVLSFLAEVESAGNKPKHDARHPIGDARPAG